MRDIHVAIGILFSGDGKILLQKRTSGRIAAGYWEFPGGKIEINEQPQEAVRREIEEEIGVIADDIVPWLVRRHHFLHETLHLHFFRIFSWRGRVIGREKQEIRWCRLDSLPLPLLHVNILICKWLLLPDIYVISTAECIGIENSLAMLPKIFNDSRCLFQLRDKKLSESDRKNFAYQVSRLAKSADILFLVNDDEDLARKIQADGIHLSTKKLMQEIYRPPFRWVGASCHNREELHHAIKRKVDFVVLSPICKTLSHPDIVPLGWEFFKKMSIEAGIPVYALGGMNSTEYKKAQSCHGQGIAMMRQAWTGN